MVLKSLLLQSGYRQQLMDNKEPQNYTPLPDEMMPVRKLTVADVPLFKGRVPDALVPQIRALKEEIKAPIIKAQKEARAKTVEINRLARLKKNRIVIEQKLDAFFKEFVKNGGNGTQAMLTINPDISLTSAASMATMYMRELKAVGRVYMEKKGHSYGKLMDIAMKKASESKTPEWWDRLMKIGEYEDFLTKEKKGGNQVVNIIQSHKDLTSTYIDGEVEEAEIVE